MKHNIMSTLLVAALFALLPSLAHADCPEDICVGGDADPGLSFFADADTYLVHGEGPWSMTTRGTSYEYVTHYYLYNDAATTHTIDTVDFYFHPSDLTSFTNGACNWAMGINGWFTACDIYMCLSDAYQSYCQELAVDAIQLGTSQVNHARFEGFASLLLEAYGSLAIDLIYEPTGSGSISPAVTSVGETIWLNFQ
jgi:hypothetical protein